MNESKQRSGYWRPYGVLDLGIPARDFRRIVAIPFQDSRDFASGSMFVWFVFSSDLSTWTHSPHATYIYCSRKHPVHTIMILGQAFMLFVGTVWIECFLAGEKSIFTDFAAGKGKIEWLR